MAATGHLDAEHGVGQQGDGDPEENDGQGHQQNGQGNFIGGFLPLGVFHHCDHPIHEGFPRIDCDPHQHPIRQHPGAAGDGGEIPTGLPNHRGGFPGDGGFIHGGHPFDHFPIGRDEIPRLGQDHIPFA